MYIKFQLVPVLGMAEGCSVVVRIRIISDVVNDSWYDRKQGGQGCNGWAKCGRGHTYFVPTCFATVISGDLKSASD